MEIRSTIKPRGVVLTSTLWMAGFFFVAITPNVSHGQQRNANTATTFGYVVNEVDNTVSVIDVGSNKVVATIPVGGLPDGVATTPDGTHAYVTNGFDNTVSVIDVRSNKVVATIPVGVDPCGVAITPERAHSSDDNDRRHQFFAYVANQVDNTVSVIDTASNTVVATIPVGQDPFGVSITSDGTHAYVTNQLDDSVSVIDTDSKTVVATIPVGGGPEGVAITPNGTDGRPHQHLAYVTNTVAFAGSSNFPASTVSVIDTVSNTAVATIPVGNGPDGIAIIPDGSRAYVGNGEDTTVSVIDTARNTVVATIQVGTGPIGVAIIPDGIEGSSSQPLAYVTNFVGNTVSVIDTDRNKVVATIPVGNFPSAVAFATVTPSPAGSEQ